MLYFFYGTDTDKARAKARGLVEALRKKKPDAEVFSMDSDNFSEAKFEEFIGGQGLFERKFIVYGNRIFENQEAKVFVMEKLKEIAVSENIFILLEGPVDAAALKKIEKAGGKVQKYGEKNEAKEKKDFSLTEALGRRDKKTLWVLFQKEIMKGKEVEELHGLLFWQIKSMIVSLNSRSAVEAEMHPFVFQKSRAFAKNYSEDELKNLSSKLVSLYHDSRRGLHDFNTALERFILTI